jgi:hypothetical protein
MQCNVLESAAAELVDESCRLSHNMEVSYNGGTSKSSISGWWFGTFIFPYIGNVIIPTDEVHHFSEGLVETTNQIFMGFPRINHPFLGFPISGESLTRRQYLMGAAHEVFILLSSWSF